MPEEKPSFWRRLGVFFAQHASKLLRPKADGTGKRMTQRSGDNSTNYQAGDTIHVGSPAPKRGEKGRGR